MTTLHNVFVVFTYGPGQGSRTNFPTTAALVVELQRVAGVPQTGIWDDRTNEAIVARLLSRSSTAAAQVLRDLQRDQRQITPVELRAAAEALGDVAPTSVSLSGATPFRWGTMAPSEAQFVPPSPPAPVQVPSAAPAALPWYRLGPAGMGAGGVVVAMGAAMLAIRFLAPKR